MNIKKFEITNQDGETYSGFYHAVNHEDAAEQWAEWFDGETAEYYFQEGGSEIITVKDIESGIVKKLKVHASVITNYFADTVEEE